MKKQMLSAMAVVAVLTVPSVASAVPIASTNLQAWIASGELGVVIAGPTLDTFTTAAPPPPSIGTLENFVAFNEETGNYTYIHVVTPSVNNISEFNTGFAVAGFTGVAGWHYGQAAAAGGSGTAADFTVDLEDGGLDFETEFLQGGSSGFDAGEVIAFFFVSTKPPTTGDYNLINSEVGTAQSFAPIPEPGSMALLGSGILGLIARRRRQAKNG